MSVVGAAPSAVLRLSSRARLLHPLFSISSDSTPSNLPAQSAEPQCLDSGNWASFLFPVPILQTTVMNLLPYRSGWAWLLLISLSVEAQEVPFHYDPATWSPT